MEFKLRDASGMRNVNVIKIPSFSSLLVFALLPHFSFFLQTPLLWFSGPHDGKHSWPNGFQPHILCITIQDTYALISKLDPQIPIRSSQEGSKIAKIILNKKNKIVGCILLDSKVTTKPQCWFPFAHWAYLWHLI